jgi:hypothetical protein
MKVFKDSPLSKNRAEELGYDLWENFVIPPYFEKLDILNATKSRIVIGGRGCGKTMLLRYFCHQTVFSKKRKKINANDLKHVGLYWRIDTQFASMMDKRGREDSMWISCFEHFATLQLSIELINSLKSIGESNFRLFSLSDLNSLEVNSPSSFNSACPLQILQLETFLKKEQNYFQTWLNNINKMEQPVFLPIVFLKELVREIVHSVSIFNKSNFYVYVDEYENLLFNQQKLLNTWVKHNEIPVIFNLAMKKNSFLNKQTLGAELLSDIHDYRTIDLEAYYSEEREFEVFASEIILQRLEGIYDLKAPLFNSNNLRDVTKIDDRKNASYVSGIMATIHKIFPGVTVKELAIQIFEDPTLKRRLIKLISEALKLKQSALDPLHFIDEKFAEGSIVIFSLLYRNKANPDEILREFDNYRASKANKFSKETNWIHNNIVGCILYVFETSNKPCQFYSGFNTFCKLSKGNIRHLMELSHKSIARADDQGITSYKKELVVDPNFQAEAAKFASAAFLNEIRTFGRYGNKLHNFTLRLGGIFQHAHLRKTQSEPEQNHFAITRGTKELSDKDYEIINEAIKWSVLSEEKSTKQKSESHTDITEYVLNPIYAPFFHISYRKKRRLEFTSDDFLILLNGNLDEFSGLIKQFIKSWEINLNEVAPTLFSGLKFSEE